MRKTESVQDRCWWHGPVPVYKTSVIVRSSYETTFGEIEDQLIGTALAEPDYIPRGYGKTIGAMIKNFMDSKDWDGKSVRDCALDEVTVGSVNSWFNNFMRSSAMLICAVDTLDFLSAHLFGLRPYDGYEIEGVLERADYSRSNNPFVLGGTEKRDITMSLSNDVAVRVPDGIEVSLSPRACVEWMEGHVLVAGDSDARIMRFTPTRCQVSQSVHHQTGASPQDIDDSWLFSSIDGSVLTDSDYKLILSSRYDARVYVNYIPTHWIIGDFTDDDSIERPEVWGLVNDTTEAVAGHATELEEK